ncbi:hypothetical protein IEO21_02305 [Rhodonia placenta]|uniref:Uncharacterized protein n=1 Tax=Rhodonia placenta TaxID=104341 RepID=A0A8H7U560_9APHY|nr:hypothetical protein IEO21_02305 [Postia placenta]
MSCHASAPCDWGRTHGELFPPSSPLPFSTSPDVLPLCLINLELEGADVTLSHTIVTYTRPFLAIANKYMRLSTQGKDSFRSVSVPWQDWGPRSTFWFSDHPDVWGKATTHGYRVMTPTTLYDFTPQGNGQTAGDTISSRIVYGTDVDERGWLYESIKTSTPFRVSELTGMQFSTYVIDEEVLAVKVPLRDQYRVNSLHVPCECPISHGKGVRNG